jgi:protein-tyrosine-phosphatase
VSAGRPCGNVLFLCTGNSARSIMAECALNRWGRGRFKAFSTGSHPKGVVHPLTLNVLKELNYEISYLRSKSCEEFVQADSPALDFIFTVCDQAAAENRVQSGPAGRQQRIGA